MKNLITTLFIAISMLLCISSYADSGSKNITANKISPTSDPLPTDYCQHNIDNKNFDFGTSIDTSNAYMFDSVDSITEISHFHSYFKYKTGPGDNDTVTLVNDDDKIRIDQFQILIDDINATIQEHNDEIRPDINYTFSGLKIHYGIRNNRIKLFYEPVVLFIGTETANSATAFIDAQRFFSGKIYESDNNGQLSLVNPLNFNNDTADYHNNIYIIHNRWWDRNNHSFIRSERFKKGDTNYCTLPIQQVLKAYCDNLNGRQSQPDDIISFSLYASNYFKFKWLRPNAGNYKLHIVASFGPLKNYRQEMPPREHGFEGSAADFGQMCPPNCGYVQVPPVQ